MLAAAAEKAKLETAMVAMVFGDKITLSEAAADEAGGIEVTDNAGTMVQTARPARTAMAVADNLMRRITASGSARLAVTAESVHWAAAVAAAAVAVVRVEPGLQRTEVVVAAAAAVLAAAQAPAVTAAAREGHRSPLRLCRPRERSLPRRLCALPKVVSEAVVETVE